MKEGPFNNFEKEEFIGAENSYFANIRHDEKLVWKRIEEKLGNKRTIPFWVYSLAASILIISGMGFFFSHTINQKNHEIDQLLISLNKSTGIVENNDSFLSYPIKTPDVIVREVEKTVYLTKTVTDTVYLYDTLLYVKNQTDTIFVFKNEKFLEEQTEKISFAENQNVESGKIKSGKKRSWPTFIFFGKNKEDNATENISNSDKQGLLTFKSK
jgi:hypothetical protein